MEENKEIQKEQFDEEEFLKKVENAASKGSNRANFKQIIISSLPSIILIVILAFLIVPKINSLNKSSRRPKSFSRYSVKENIVTFQKDNLNDNMFNYENKQNKTPFRVYYNEFSKKTNEQPFKLYKNNFNSNDYNSCSNNTNCR